MHYYTNLWLVRWTWPGRDKQWTWSMVWSWMVWDTWVWTPVLLTMCSSQTFTRSVLSSHWLNNTNIWLVARAPFPPQVAEMANRHLEQQVAQVSHTWFWLVDTKKDSLLIGCSGSPANSFSVPASSATSLPFNQVLIPTTCDAASRTLTRVNNIQ